MKQITGPELMALRGSGPSDTARSWVLLDVRERWEFEIAAIRVDGMHTLHMPMGAVTGRLNELDPAQPVVCICHHGVRSAQVVAFLARQGFEAAYNLAGGIDAWSEQVDPALPRY